MAQLAGPLEGAQASPCQAASDHGKVLLCTTVHSVHNCLALLKEPKLVHVKLLQTMVRGYCAHLYILYRTVWPS